ncbi:hypothetical protein TREES_T100001741 [Tupaia chinensis]|uniref:Uncharacterized protein n=1 Tax=Tupaia chinensis TaxID=246437 RepID=L9KKF0_TUPCH|nr:hypothetical protein TREES_T100001741 [Tupaia chinensis]
MINVLGFHSPELGQSALFRQLKPRDITSQLWNPMYEKAECKRPHSASQPEPLSFSPVLHGYIAKCGPTGCEQHGVHHTHVTSN